MDRETLKKRIEETMQSSSEEAKQFRERLKYNKINSTTIDLDEKMKEIVRAILKGEMTAKEASDKYHIDRETIRRKINQQIAEDDSLIQEYVAYVNKNGRDYSRINFTGLIVHMIKRNFSQSEMAKAYAIPTRTISREIEKLKKSSDPKENELYEIAKRYADKKMKRAEISEDKLQNVQKQLDEMFGDIPIIEVDAKTKDEIEIERLEKFCEQVDIYQAQGMQTQEIAEKMKSSISTIRRNRLKLAELKKKEEINEKIEGR